MYRKKQRVFFCCVVMSIHFEAVLMPTPWRYQVIQKNPLEEACEINTTAWWLFLDPKCWKPFLWQSEYLQFVLTGTGWSLRWSHSQQPFDPPALVCRISGTRLSVCLRECSRAWLDEPQDTEVDEERGGNRHVDETSNIGQDNDKSFWNAVNLCIFAVQHSQFLGNQTVSSA